jgi:hypothetical protein
MSTKKQKIGEIFASLQSDLLRLNEVAASRFVKRAWMFESAYTNTADALKNLKSAKESAEEAVKGVPVLAREGKIKDPTAVLRDFQLLNKSISAQVRAFELELEKPLRQLDYWAKTGPSFLKQKKAEIESMLDAAKKSSAAPTSLAIFDTPAEDLLDPITRALSDAVDEIENAQSALGDSADAASVPAAQPDAAVAPSPDGAAAGDEASQAYDTYILGGKKALDEFFDKYNVEQDPKDPNFIKEYFDIVKKHIIDSKQVQTLMLNADKQGEAREKLIRMPRFIEAAQKAHNAVVDQIQIASNQIDQADATLPER